MQPKFIFGLVNSRRLHTLTSFIRHDHDAITETQSLCFSSIFIGSLFSLASFVISAMTSERFCQGDSFEKPRQGSLAPIYITIVSKLTVDAQEYCWNWPIYRFSLEWKRAIPYLFGFKLVNFFSMLSISLFIQFIIHYLFSELRDGTLCFLSFHKDYVFYDRRWEW